MTAQPPNPADTGEGGLREQLDIILSNYMLNKQKKVQAYAGIAMDDIMQLIHKRDARLLAAVEAAWPKNYKRQLAELVSKDYLKGRNQALDAALAVVREQLGGKS